MGKLPKETCAGKTRSPGDFFIRALWWISAAALILRLAAALEMALSLDGCNNVLHPLSTSDLATYMTLGRQCAQGMFPETFYYQPWYYAVFLALCNIIGGGAVWVVILLQALFSAATVWLTGWCCRRVFSARAGLIAAGLCAVSSSLILYVPFQQNETLQTFHLILLFAVTLTALEKNTAFRWSIAGLIAGIAILTRGNVWLLIPVILGGLFLFGRKSGVKFRRALLHAGAFTAAMLLIQLPFIIRNTVNTGELTGPSTAAGVVLALGNTPEAPAGGRAPGSTAGPMVYPEAYHRMMANTQGDFARSVPRQMWDWFVDHPAAFLELQFRKALLFWDHREIPNNVSLDFDGVMCSRVLRYLVIGRNAVLFTLGTAGIVFFLGELFRKRKRELVMLYGFSAAFYCAVVVFYILSRFKAPMIPFLAVFGGGAVDGWISLVGAAPPGKKRIAVGKALICLLIGLWFSHAAYDTYRDCEAAVNRLIYPDGIVLDMNGANIQYFDYGPMPFGGWTDVKLLPGMSIVKDFAGLGTSAAEIRMTFRSSEEAEIALIVNGQPGTFRFPEVPPGKNDRKMIRFPASVMNGRTEIRVVAVRGGEVWCTYDMQRNYRRSFLDGRVLDGEWVIRAAVPR